MLSAFHSLIVGCAQYIQSSGASSLPQARQFSFADIIALGFAAALLTIFICINFLQLLAGLRNTLVALGITVIFALVAWSARGVNLGGALAGWVIAFILAARNLRMFCLLLVVFVVTLAATRLGSSRKQELRIAEAARGRSASQVMANLGVAGFIAALGVPGWTVLALAALAEAAADTSSSEVGLAFPGKTVLITSWKAVAPGVDGGITLHGTAAALAAASVVALAARFVGLVPGYYTAIVICAGFLASLADSLMGALLERRGWLNNDLVNLLSTAIAVLIAWLLA